MAAAALTTTLTGLLWFVSKTPTPMFDTEVQQLNLTTGTYNTVATLPASIESTIAVEAACATSSTFVLSMQQTANLTEGYIASIDLATHKIVSQHNISVVCNSIHCVDDSTVVCASLSSSDTSGGLSLSRVNTKTGKVTPVGSTFGPGLDVSRIYAWNNKANQVTTLMATPPSAPKSHLYLATVDFDQGKMLGNASIQYQINSPLLQSLAYDNSIDALVGTAFVIKTPKDVSAFGRLSLVGKNMSKVEWETVGNGSVLKTMRQLNSVATSFNGVYYSTAFIGQGNNPIQVLLAIDVKTGDVVRVFDCPQVGMIDIVGVVV